VVSQDYRYGLIRAVLTVQPRRSVLFGTRLALLGLLGASVAAVTSLLTAGICWVADRPPASDPTTLRLVGSHVVLAVLWTWLGAGLTWLMRAATGPLAVLLVVPLLVEPVLAAVSQVDQFSLLRPLVRVLPFTAGHQLLSVETARSAEAVGALLGGALFCGYLVVLLAGAWLSLTSRDA
jgi:ABC-2 type transport system permease protein